MKKSNRIIEWVKKNNGIAILMAAIVTIVMVVTISTVWINDTPEVPYTKMMEMIEKGEVERVELNIKKSALKFHTVDQKKYVSDNPGTEDFRLFLLESGVRVSDSIAEYKTIPEELLMTTFKFAIIALLIAWIISALGKHVSNSQKVRDNSKKEKSRITQVTTRFKDIAGHEELKEDLKLYVDMMKNSSAYTEMGAKLPKGLIFYGPPGTGKTLAAKALAGESGVNFLYASGSDFIEKYVGVGAKRVRQLFNEAKENAPCILFIDEIDAVAKQRGSTNNSEADNTVNALLVELDGFKDTEGVLVITATNRIEDLDEGFKRPGRFDRKIAIGYPDYSDRIEIFKVHLKGKKLDKKIKLEDLSKMTHGFTGAGIESLLNISAIEATRNKRKSIIYQDIDKAHYLVVMDGDQKKGVLNRDELEVKTVAYHEAGHALVAKLLTDHSVPKVTIMPSTNGAGGVTFFTPKERGLKSKIELLNEVQVSYGGRAAEELFFDDTDKITTGASNDIQQATNILCGFVGAYGMSEELGMVNLKSIGIEPKYALNEVSKMAKELYTKTVELLKENKEKLDKIATILLEKETINEDELDEVIYGKKLELNKEDLIIENEEDEEEEIENTIKSLGDIAEDVKGGIEVAS